MEPSARVTGLGSAFSALSDDSTAILYNPAGLVDIDGYELSGSFFKPFTGAKLYENFISTGKYIGQYAGGVAIGWHSRGAFKLKRTDTLFLSYAHLLDKKFVRVGVTVKWFIFSVPGYKEYNDPNFLAKPQLAVSFDLGAKLVIKDFAFGVTVFNINKPKYKLISTGAPEYIYRDIRAGVKYSFLDNKITVMFDFATIDGKVTDIWRHFFAGVEANIGGIFFARTGYSGGAVAMGIGFRVKGFSVDTGLKIVPNLGVMMNWGARLNIF
ncbi:MAG: hypothetical protein KAS39_04220 [Actinomycetia bacterium]|nr:hypothetical protein [Actinomycetes bacterium]